MIKMRNFLLLAATAVLAVSGQQARYDNYKVYRVIPNSEDQLKALQNLENIVTDFPTWKVSRKINDPSDVLVPPHKVRMFHDILEASQLSASVLIHDVQELFDQEMSQVSKRQKAVDWQSYHTLEEIYDWLDELASANSNIEVVSAGKTYEGREIKGIEITNGEGLPGIIFESGIHAREWIGPAATSWIINEIINSASNSIWRQFNYLYLPVVNPDGYVFTWEKDRAWRKTRVPYRVGGLITCYGADPNRNWDFHWMEGGSTSNACSETFAGPEAFSEPEVASLAQFLASKASNYDIYVAFHSYSQLLMYPWGYTGTDTPLEATWKRIGLAAAQDLEAVYGTQFEVGSIFDTIYQASGSSIEWYYGNYNSTLTFVFELRDTGRYGFALPADQIIPSGQELIKAIERFATEYQKLPAKTSKK